MENLNYKIQDYFKLPDLGVIVSIASPELDKLSNNEIKDLIGSHIAIMNAETQKKKRVEVSEIDIATSILDKKNIHICLGNIIELSEIKPNSDIVLVAKEELEKTHISRKNKSSSESFRGYVGH